MINMIFIVAILFSITILLLDFYKKKADKIMMESESFDSCFNNGINQL